MLVDSEKIKTHDDNLNFTEKRPTLNVTEKGYGDGGNEVGKSCKKSRTRLGVPGRYDPWRSSSFTVGDSRRRRTDPSSHAHTNTPLDSLSNLSSK